MQTIQMNAGIIATAFDTSTGAVSDSNILGATSGGVNFVATPAFTDYGEDIDNCPKNMKELKQLDSWEVKMSGTFVAVTRATAKLLVGLGDIAGNKITPRNSLSQSDFADLWWIGDYTNVNTGDGAGFIAIHMMNGLSTGGFQIQSTDKGKGQFAFEFTGHFSINAQDTVPFEVYVVSSAETELASVELSSHAIELAINGTHQLAATTTPAGQTVTWSTGNSSTATVSSGLVTGKAAGNTIITASITVDGVTYTDTCTVVVPSAS